MFPILVDNMVSCYRRRGTLHCDVNVTNTIIRIEIVPINVHLELPLCKVAWESVTPHRRLEDPIINVQIGLAECEDGLKC